MISNCAIIKIADRCATGKLLVHRSQAATTVLAQAASDSERHSDTYVRAAEVLLAFSAFEQAYTVLLLNLI